MPSAARNFRVLLPRPLYAELTARARVENIDLNTFILRAVTADLRECRPGPEKRAKRRKHPKK